MRLAQSSGLARKQLSEDLGVGLSTLNRWVSSERNTVLMSGPHDDLEKENARLRKEVKLLREEREILKLRRSVNDLVDHLQPITPLSSL